MKLVIFNSDRGFNLISLGEIRRTCPTFFVAGPTKIVFFPDQMSDIDFGVYFFTHERK